MSISRVPARIAGASAPSCKRGLLCCMLWSVLAAVSPLLAQTEELQKLLPGDGAGTDLFGRSVAISGDVLVVGASEDNETFTDQGSAYVYRREDGVWTEEQKLLSPNPNSFDYFGFSVAVSGDVVVVGSRNDDVAGSNAGAAYVFEYDGANWNLEDTLIGSNTTANDEFGVSVAVDGNVILVGAHLDDPVVGAQGAAYVFRKGLFGWIEEDRLVDSNGAGSDEFGFAVALDGEVAAVGARYDNEPSTDTGSVVVFRYDGGTQSWDEEQKLTAAALGASDYFGNSVDVAGDVVVAGAWGDNDLGGDAGTAYVFRYDAGTQTWNEEAQLLAPDGGSPDRFGIDVATSGTVCVVGAYLHDFPGTDNGAAYAYRYCGGTTWVFDQKLVASDRAGNDYHGVSVAIDGDRIATGAHGNDDLGGDSGAAYVFTAAQIELLSNRTDVFAGETLTLTTHTGTPGSLVAFFLLTLEGVPFPDGMLLLAPSDSTGRLVLSTVWGGNPMGVSPWTAGFLSFEKGSCDRIAASNLLEITFH
jgi:hypothetical protein